MSVSRERIGRTGTFHAQTQNHNRRQHLIHRRRDVLRSAAWATFESLEQRRLLAGEGVLGQYFYNIDFTGATAYRHDQQIDFYWSQEELHDTIQNNGSVRWTGKLVVPTAGQYTFFAHTDDGVRLWINDVQIIDDWVEGASERTSSVITLPAGQVNLKMEYFDTVMSATAKLRWQGPGISKQIVPNANLLPGYDPSLPTGWSNSDIGAVGAAGSTDYHPASGTFTIRGSGADIYGSADEFQFARTTMTGDGEIIARLTGYDYTDDWNKVGLMLRESDAANSRFVGLFNTRRAGIAQHRSTTGGSVSSQAESTNGNELHHGVYWLKIARSGDTFTLSRATNPQFTSAEVRTITLSGLPSTLLAGLAVTSHNDGVIHVATFDNVTVTGEPAQPPSQAPVITGITATHSAKSVTLDFTDGNTDESEFIVSRKQGSGGSWVDLPTRAPANATSYVDSDPTLLAGTQYFYRIRAANSAGSGPNSTEASLTTPTAPVAPTGLAATPVNHSRIDLDWDFAGSTATGFIVDRSQSSSMSPTEGTTSVGLTPTEASDTGWTTPLQPSTTYYYRVRAENAWGVSTGSFAGPVTTPALPAVPAPLVKLDLNENTGTSVANSGTIGGSLTRTSPVPAWSTNTPSGIGGTSALDFGTSTGNYGVDSPGIVPQLGGLTTFTISGWLNNRSSSEGAGGNRIVTWTKGYFANDIAPGVDLVYRSDGSLHLGVNKWVDSSPARSSSGKITTNSSAPTSNWTFFAVTYDGTQSANNVKFYFGDTVTDAVLDVTRSYDEGAVSTDIGIATLGHFNPATRPGATDRMFRGLIDGIQVHGDVLTLEQIKLVQRLPTLAIADASANEGDSGTKQLSFTVTRGGDISGASSVNWATSNGTATAGSDYLAASGTAQFIPGQSTATINVTILGDTTVEPDETFTVTLSNPAGATLATATATGTILNDDTAANQPPVVNNQTFSIAENSSNSTVVGTVSASDPDAGQNLTYAITAGNTDNAFAINAATGQITVANSSALDFETIPSFALTVQVTDNGTPALSDTATVTINLSNVNEAPTDITLSSSSVAENQPSGTTVGTFSTADPDAGNTFTYSLVSGTGATDNASFTIQDGALKTADPFDYEAKSSYSIRVRSTDQGGLWTEKVFTIGVTNVNEAPTAGAIAKTLNEDTTLTFAAADFTNAFDDPDDGNTLAKIRIESLPSQGTLRLGGVAVTFNQEIATAQLANLTYTPPADWNGNTSFTYKASDGTLWSAAAGTVTLTVNPVNDAPGFTKGADQSITVNAGPQSILNWATNLSKGPANEASQTLSFEITGNTNTALFSALPQVSPTGTLTYTPAPDATGTATITLRIRDDGGTANGGADASPTQTFTITITPSANQAPVINNQTLGPVPENSPNDTVVGTVSASDPDAGQSLTYIITAGNTNGAFAINAATGQITVANSSALDFETIPAFGLTVQVTDNGSPALSNSATVAINLTNINEAPTDIILSTTAIAENQPSGTTVGTFSTDDPDADNTFTYSLVSGTGSTDNASFTIQGNTLKTTASFDYETKSSYSIRVRSTDQGALWTEKVFMIGVTNVNEAPTAAPINKPINEDAVLTFAAADFTAAFSDPDAGNTLQKIQVVTLPSQGTLRLGGVAVTLNQEIATAQLANLTYTPPADWNGNTSFTYNASDGSLWSISAAAVNLTVNPVNDAPIITVPGPQTVNQDATLSVSGLSIADVDLGAGFMRVSLSVAHGSLTLSTLANLTFSSGDGVADASMTFDGALAAINAALAGMTYTPATSYIGPDTLTITANDQGNTGAGGAQTDTDTVSINVVSAGAPTVLTAVGITDGAVLLTWQNNGAANTIFEIDRATDDAFTTDLATFSTVAGATAYQNSGLSSNSQYFYRVRVSGAPASATSNTAAATTLTTGSPGISIMPAMAGDPRADTIGGTAFGADGGDSVFMSYSGGAVRYHDGREFHSTADLDPAEPGSVSGITRTWSNDPLLQKAGAAVGLGGWSLSQMPTLVKQDADTVAVVDGGRSIRWFDRIGPSLWQGRYFSLDTLAGDFTTGFTLTDTTANTTTFAPFVGAAEVSLPVTHTDAGGNQTAYTYAAGKLDKIERKHGTSVVLEELSFTYTADLQTSVVMKRLSPATSSLEVVRKVAYTYADGKLHTATVLDASDTAVDRKHYRYDGQNLKIVLEGASFERAVGPTAFGGGGFADPTAGAVTDEQLRPFADLFFAYDVQGRLIKQQMQGMGTYQYEYEPSRSAAGLNEWAYKTIEYLPDPSLPILDTWSDPVAGNDANIVYTNLAGQIVASVFETATDAWATAYQYDAAGRLTLSAEPSAVQASLLNETNADIVTPALRANDGLIYVSDYYSSADPAAGYLQFAGVQRGTSGPAHKQTEWVYAAQRPNSGGRLVTSEIVYRGENGTLPVATGYAYTFHSGQDRVQQRTTTLAAISAAQNGSGTTATTIEQFDTFGRIVSVTDGDDKVYTFAYDDATGAITTSIIDAGTGGLQLDTLFESDGLGRTTKITDPMGRQTTIQYTDLAAYQEMRTTPPTTTGTTPPPLSVSRVDRRTGQTDDMALTRDGVSVLSLTRWAFNASGQLTAVERVENTDSMTYTVPGGVAGGGTLYRTEYAYDGRGRQDKVVAGRDFYSGSMNATNPTITRSTYDALDRVTAMWIGTNDAGWTPVASSHSNLVKVSANEYDDNGVGDSNLTRVTQFPGDGSPNRVTATKYDWRNRPVVTMEGVGAAAGTHPPITSVTYDNLDRPVAQRIYDGEGVSFSSINISTIDTDLASARRAFAETLYDDRSRVFRTVQHSVNQSSGAVSGSLITDSWYDDRDNIIKTKAPGGLVAKAEYDGTGRVIKQSVTDGGGDTTWAHAGNVSGDAVLEQTLTEYDKNSNVLLITTRQRYHDATGTGDLTTGSARESYVGHWFDEADRLKTAVNWGNNGGTVISSRPLTAPARASTDGWDPHLRTDQTYDDSGRLQDIVNPRGITTRQFYDSLNRPITMYEAYHNTVPGDSVDKDDDRRAGWTYNGFDQVTSVTSQTFGQIEGGGLQVRTFITGYTYGVARADGSALNHSGLLSSIGHNRATSGEPIAIETFTQYNALGENTEKITVNGSRHFYSYDVLGNLRNDEFTNADDLPATMEKDVRKLSYVYDTLGRGIIFTTEGYLPGGTSFQVLNQVEREFDGLGNLVTEWQDHDSVVVKSGGGASPSVRYVYDTNFTSNFTRQTQLVYPDGRVLWTGYDNTTLNAAISRPGYLADSNYDGSGNATTPKSTKVEQYDYLGLSRVVRRDQPEGGEGVGYTTGDLWLEPDKDDGGSADPYDGLDRFGRIVSHGWDTFNARAYAYDADGNLLSAYAGFNVDAKWRSELFHADGTAASQAYDKLGRLKTYQRGILEDNVTDANSRYDTADTSTEIRPVFVPIYYWPVGNARDTIETHYRNQQWETSEATNGFYDRIQDVSEIDDPANRKTFQRRVPIGTISRDDDPEETTDIFTQFDAWGRLGYKGTATIQAIATFGDDHTYDPTTNKPKDEQIFTYDALGRRITETRTVWTGPTTSTFRGTQHLYYDTDGNVIEERRQAVEANPATTVQYQYVRSLAGPNLIVARDSSDGVAGPYGHPNTSLSERLWVQQGPDGSVWQIEDADGGPRDVVQYLYTPEGQVLVITPQLKTYTYYDTILGQNQQITGTWYETPNGNDNLAAYDFRYLWKGMRAEVHSDASVMTGNIVDKYDGLYWTGSGEHDAWRGGPLEEDVSAYNRPASEHDQWTPTSINYPANGTSGQWASPGSVLHAMLYSSNYGSMYASNIDEVGNWDFVPVAGSTMKAWGAFRRGAWGSGLAYSFLAVTEVVPAKQLAQSVIKGVVKASASTVGRRVLVGGAFAAGTGMIDTGVFDANDAEGAVGAWLRPAVKALTRTQVKASLRTELSALADASRSQLRQARRGLVGELRMQRFVEELPHHKVIGIPGTYGTRGADLITFDARLDRLVFWDAKFRSRAVNLGMSRTFRGGTNAWRNATQEALGIVRDPRVLTFLTPSQRASAIRDLTTHGLADTHTIGFGRAKNWMFGTEVIP